MTAIKFCNRESGVIHIVDGSDRQPSGLFLLFPRGQRPDQAALREFVASQRSVSVTHDPFDQGGWQYPDDEAGPADRLAKHTQADVAEELWLELLREGLTFELSGLARGKTSPFPAIRHRFDLDATPASTAFEAVRLMPGQHLAGAERSIPVIKGMLGLARDFVHHFDELAAVVWPPSASAIGRRYFESISTAWLEGGAFPALGLTAFRETEEGALQSEGLAFWIDQEIRIEPPIANDKVAATRLGIRLVNQLILVGGVEESERIVAPDGTPLVIRPSRNGKFVQVWRE